MVINKKQHNPMASPAILIMENVLYYFTFMAAPIPGVPGPVLCMMAYVFANAVMWWLFQLITGLMHSVIFIYPVLVEKHLPTPVMPASWI